MPLRVWIGHPKELISIDHTSAPCFYCGVSFRRWNIVAHWTFASSFVERVHELVDYFQQILLVLMFTATRQPLAMRSLDAFLSMHRFLCCWKYHPGLRSQLSLEEERVETRLKLRRGPIFLRIIMKQWVRTLFGGQLIWDAERIRRSESNFCPFKVHASHPERSDWFDECTMLWNFYSLNSGLVALGPLDRDLKPSVVPRSRHVL